LSGAKTPQDLLPSEQIFVVPRNALIEVNIPGAGAHPFHCTLKYNPLHTFLTTFTVHGHTFDVVLPANDDVFNFKKSVISRVFSYLKVFLTH